MLSHVLLFYCTVKSLFCLESYSIEDVYRLPPDLMLLLSLPGFAFGAPTTVSSAATAALASQSFSFGAKPAGESVIQ